MYKHRTAILIRILQDFAAKLCHFTNFKMLLLAVVIGWWKFSLPGSSKFDHVVIQYKWVLFESACSATGRQCNCTYCSHT